MEPQDFNPSPDDAGTEAQQDGALGGALHEEPALLSDLPEVRPLGASSDDAPSSSVDAEQLGVMLSEHIRWLESEGKEGRRANLRGTDLTMFNLSQFNLAEANLRSANLSGVDLSEADLRGADLAEARLSQANLSRAQMAGSTLTRATLTGAQLEYADLSSCNATGAIANGATLTRARLQGASLRDCNLTGANLSHTELRNANIRSAILSQADLSAADLTSADCRDVAFDGAQVKGAIFKQANLRGATFAGVDLTGAEMEEAIDLSMEFKTQAVETERNKLQGEQQQVRAIREGLQSREKDISLEKRKLEADMLAVGDFMGSVNATLASLMRSRSWFTFTTIVWLIGCLAFAALSIMAVLEMEPGELDVTEMTIFFGGMALFFVMFLVSAVRAAGAARVAVQLRKAYEEKLGALAQNYEAAKAARKETA